MKKIFLTSGLVLCMACPAFATPGDGNANIDVITDEQTGAVTGTAAANCVSGVLETAEAGQYVNFKALWNANTYTVTYDKGAHAASDVNNWSDTATYDVAYTAKGAATTGVSAADGYTFIGYSTVGTTDVSRDEPAVGVTEPVNTGTVNTPWTNQNPWRFTTDKTVYATYLANQYKITYKCGGLDWNQNANEGAGAYGTPATGGDTAQIVTYDSSYTLNNGAGCSLSGYTFNGWTCTGGLSGALDNGNPASGTWSLTTGSTCTANWSANVINLTWDNNGATTGGTGGATTCTYNTGILPLPTTPTKTGYTFAGWDVQSVTATAPSNGQ